MAPERDDTVRARTVEPSFGEPSFGEPSFGEPGFGEIDDWMFKGAIVLGVLVFLYIIVLGAGTFPWILIRFGWTNQ